MTASPGHHQRPVNVIPLLLLAGILATAAGLLLLGTHATDRHGSEAEQIRRCFAENGALMELTSTTDPSVKCFIVELEPCGRWAILIAQVWPSATAGCDMRERTAFVPKDGDPDNVLDYVIRKFRP